MNHTLVDCDCTTKVHQDGSGVEVYYCPLHAAAPELLDAAKRTLHGYKNMTTEQYNRGEDKPLRELVAAAIARAEGR